LLRDAFNTSSGMLLPGRWIGSWDELDELFVAEAPNPQRRGKLLNALELWLGSVSQILPISRVWVNGGFVTYKTQIPDDIDVVAFSKADNFTEEINIRLTPLVSDLSGPIKMKPMAYGGKLDTFVVVHNLEQVATWMKNWGLVNNPVTKEIIPNLEKGFVELQL